MSSPAPPPPPPPLLTSAGAQPTRAASVVVAKPVRGFQVFRIDGFSWTKALPGGERISSEPFAVGGLYWRVDYYPNGTDASKLDSDSISLYLRLVDDAGYSDMADGGRVRAQYKFSLLDLAGGGTAAYERPVETGVFTSHGYDEDGEAARADLGCGSAEFVAKELERRRQSLLAEDRLAVRCDVGVVQVETMAVAEAHKRMGYGSNRMMAYGARGRGRGFNNRYY